MKATFARMQRARNIRGSPAIVEQPEVPVPVPAGPRDKRSFLWVSSRDTEIYPLVFCVSAGIAMGAFSLIRHMMLNPDVNLSRHRRETPTWERYTPEEGTKYSRDRHHFANLKPNPINQFPEAKTLQEEVDEPFTEHL